MGFGLKNLNLIKVLIVLLVANMIANSNMAQNSSSYFEKAEGKYKEEKYKKAVNLYNKAIELSPDSALYFLRRGKANLYLGKNQESFSDISTAIKIDPEFAEAYYLRGYFYNQINKPDKSILDYTEAYRYAKTDSLKMTCLINRSSSKMIKQDFKGAIEDCMEVLRNDSINVGAFNNIAMSLDRVGRGEETITYLKKVIQIDSTAGYAYMNIGFRLSNEGKFSESLPYFNKAIQLQPDLPNSYNNRGYVKFRLNDYKGAFEDINKSIKMDPANSYAYRNRGLVYHSQKNQKKACADWNTAIKYGYTSMYGKEVQELINTNCL